MGFLTFLKCDYIASIHGFPVAHFGTDRKDRLAEESCTPVLNEALAPSDVSVRAARKASVSRTQSSEMRR